MTNKKFNNLFGGPAREPESKIGQKEMDMAASIQVITEEVIVKLAKNIAKTTGEKNLCLAGGVALNCVANGKLIKEKIFDDVWIQPAAGDSGGALGAALVAYHMMLEQPRRVVTPDKMSGSYLGPAYSQESTASELKKCNAVFEQYDEDIIIEKTAQALAEGKAIGWMQGRAEFGPRALGNRSIIADPRSPKMQKILNLKVKFRESFRPFAPSILEEKATEWFDITQKSPYMLLVGNVLPKKQIKLSSEEKQLFGLDKLNIPKSEVPAVTHVDYSARIQTVSKQTNQKYHKLIEKFNEITGCPILVNTSFNIRGEPIINTPTDAFNCFMGTDLEILVVENCILYKEKQVINETSYLCKYDLD